jgi:hypothetical protein
MDSEEERLLKKGIQSVVDQLVLAAEQGNVGAQILLGIECMVGVNVQKEELFLLGMFTIKCTGSVGNGL